MSTVIEISGLDEMAKKLDRLAEFAYKDVFGKACKASAQIVEREAKSLAPVKTGALQKAIRVRAGRAKKGNWSYIAAVSNKWFVGDFFYGAFQEFGWKHGGRLGRKNKNRKDIPGEHFMEYAFEEKKQEALRVMQQMIWEGLERELAN